MVAKSTKEVTVARSDEMELLRLRHENASLSRLFDERAEYTARLLEERAKLNALVEQSAKTLEDLAHHLRTALRG
jgi:hypothetical protein